MSCALESSITLTSIHCILPERLMRRYKPAVEQGGVWPPFYLDHEIRPIGLRAGRQDGSRVIVIGWDCIRQNWSRFQAPEWRVNCPLLEMLKA